MASTVVFLLVLQVVVCGHAAGLNSVSSPDGGVAEALLALDTDKSGKVEKAEVEAFAKSQGLTAEQVQSEFKDLDLNGDGELSAEEIASTLQDSVASLPAQTVTAATTATIAQPPSVAATSANLVAASPVVTPAANDAMQNQLVEVARQQPAAAVEPPKAAAIAAPQPKPIPEAAQDSAPVALAHVENTATQVDSQMSAITLDAEQHAGKALAEVFARSAAKALEARSQDDLKANKLEEQAKSLRGQSAELKRTAAAVTIKAATDAAEAVMKEAATQERALQEAAAKAEKEAQERRQYAKAAMEKAVRAQADMSASLQNSQTQ